MSKIWMTTLVLYFLCNHGFADDCNYDTVYHYQFSSDLSDKINKGREIIKYNSQQQKTDLLYQVWDRNKNIWQNDNLNKYTYNTKGDVTVDFQQTWDLLNGIWINDSRNNYTYDGNYSLTEEIFHTWDTEINEWRATSKETFSYDEFNLKTEHLSQFLFKNDTIWTSSFKFKYIYDSNNILTEEILQNWRSSGWKNEYKINYSYTSNKIAYKIYKYWNGDEFKSVNDLEYFYSYDGSLLVEVLIKRRGLWTDIFEAAFKWTYNYDAVNNHIELFKEIYTAKGWVKDERNMNTYNSGGCLTASDNYFYGDKYLQDDTTKFRIEYKYGTTTTNLPSGVWKPTLKIFPNPAFDKITVELPGGVGDFSIFNIHGQLVHKGVADSNSFDIDIHSLTSGVYAIHLFFEDKSLKTKFIKQ